jgi:hypothetical protein
MAGDAFVTGWGVMPNAPVDNAHIERPRPHGARSRR